VGKFVDRQLAKRPQSDQYLKKQTVLIVFSAGVAVQLNPQYHNKAAPPLTIRTGPQCPELAALRSAGAHHERLYCQ
jgi:hypothetical protein